MVHGEGINGTQEYSDEGDGEGSTDERRNKPYDEFQAMVE